MVKPNVTELLDIVSSRVKAELLRLLFGLAHPELHLRELVRRSGLSLATVQQELRRLARIGVVTVRKDGNRVYYRANESHPLHAELSGLVLKTTGLIGVLAPLASDRGVQIAFVFGSVARGETGAESDVDLMVIGTITLRRTAQLLSGVTEKIGRELNPHIFSPEEFAARRSSHFLASVLASPKLFVKGTERELAAMGQ